MVAIPSVRESRNVWILVVLSLLMAFASISTDLYLPAMPQMQAALAANAGSMEFTISGYLIGFSLGQLLWGPIGDRVGRRLPVGLGLLLFIAGSAGCAMSDTPTALIGWRMVQAAGACASVVLARAMVRDLYVGDEAARMMSVLMTVMAIAPLVGPSVGGLLLHMWSWRAIFWALVGVGLLTLAALWTIPETLDRGRRSREPLRRALFRYGELLSNRRLVAYLGVGGLFYGGMFAYIAGTPFAYIDYYHVPAQRYGLLFGVGIVGIMATNLMNARLVGRLDGDRIMRGGAMAAAVAGIVVAFDGRSGWGGIAGIVVPLFVFVSAAGFIVANAITGALSVFPESTGAVSALVGATQYGTGVLGSALVGMFADGTPSPMGLVIAALGVGCALFAFSVVPGSRTKEVAQGLGDDAASIGFLARAAPPTLSSDEIADLQRPGAAPQRLTLHGANDP